MVAITILAVPTSGRGDQTDPQRDSAAENPTLIQQIERENLRLLETHPLHVVVEYFERTDGEAAPATRCEYWKSDDGVLAIISKESRQTAMGFNAEYGFSVEQEEGESTWTLRKISSPREVLSKLQGHLSNALISSYVEFQPLHSLIPEDANHFSIVQHDDRVELKINQAPKTSRPRFVRSGSIWLDPKYSYAVTDFDLEIVSPVDTARVSGNCVYSDDRSDSGYPMPCGRKLSYYGNSMNPDEIVEIIASIESIAFTPPAVDRFRLTSFGLPEPELPGISLSWVVLIVVLLLIFVIGGAARTNHSNGHRVTAE